MSIRVMVVDNHGIVREGLCLLINQQDDMEVVGQAFDGREAVELAVKLQPDVVVMEVCIPGLNGVDATRQILKKSTHTKVLALSAHSDKQFVSDMLKAGASGYVLKNGSSNELLDAIRIVDKGERYLSSKIAGIVINDYVNGNGAGVNDLSVNRLTGKERELLQLLVEGRVAKVAAKILHVSVKTVDARRRDIMNKLGVSSLSQLTKFALREGITTLEF